MNKIPGMRNYKNTVGSSFPALAKPVLQLNTHFAPLFLRGEDGVPGNSPGALVAVPRSLAASTSGCWSGRPGARERDGGAPTAAETPI